MGEEELNELSMNELEQVAGGAQPPSSYYRPANGITLSSFIRNSLKTAALKFEQQRYI